MPTIFRDGLFAGHVAIVTGGGSGIGLATASALGELGAKVAICGRKKEKLESAEQALRPTLRPLEPGCYPVPKIPISTVQLASMTQVRRGEGVVGTGCHR